MKQIATVERTLAIFFMDIDETFSYECFGQV